MAPPPAPDGVSSELLAIRLFAALVGNANAVLPDIDLFDAAHTIPWDADSAVLQPVEKVTIEQLVEYFHAMMAGYQTHLAKEYDSGRITGAKYADTYVALTQSAMAGAVQFALGKDQAFWLAAKGQAEAITAHNQNEVMKLEAMLKRAAYALTKLKLATEDSTFGVSELQREGVLPGQILLTAEQVKMTAEQKEAQRAQTLDTREDELTNPRTIANSTELQGMLGKQKALYTQQIVSYKEDTKIKAAQIFSSLWVTQSSVSDGVIQPSAYFQPWNGVGQGTPAADNASAKALDGVFKHLRKTAIGPDGDANDLNYNPYA